MEHILVPIDFSEASMLGVKKAIAIAEKEKAEIHLVNIISPNPQKKDKPKEEILDNTLNRLRENADKLSEWMSNVTHDGVQIHSEIKVDLFEKGIKKYLKNHPIDLIVVGVNGAHTVGDLFCHGRDKKHVQVDCPVEVVKA